MTKNFRSKSFVGGSDAAMGAAVAVEAPNHSQDTAGVPPQTPGPQPRRVPSRRVGEEGSSSDITPLYKGMNLFEAIKSGMTADDIMDECGCSYDALRRALSRRGLAYLRRDSSDPRALIQDMKKDDAISFLLNMVEILMRAEPEAETAIEHLNLPQTPRQIALILMSSPGVTFSREALLDRLYSTTSAEEVPMPKIIDVYICRLRKKVPQAMGFFENVWGVGYRWIPAPETQIPSAPKSARKNAR